MKKNLLPKEGELFLFNNFFSPKESDNFFQSLLKNIKWRQDKIKIYGKEFLQPRLTYWVAEKSYTYSGITMKANSWNDDLLMIKEKIKGRFNITFNSVLLNLYRNGKDSMGWHRDNEKEFGINPIIASVSFGNTRIFRLRHLEDYKKNKQKKLTTTPISIPLSHGSLLLMQGETQHKWEHEIKKSPTSKKEDLLFNRENLKTEKRINLTFRIVKN